MNKKNPDGSAKKLKMHTPDFTDANVAEVARLFPNCVTEARDGDGAVTRTIDFDLLRQELSGHVVEGPAERYHLNWPGKREALLAANAPIAKTLRPVRDESVDFDTTKNLFIEGDNLDALKLLQETYLGKVKMIYIDPPYNTGKEFIYDDDFAEDKDDYLIRSGQKGDDGERMTANTEANGRFHSDWLSMMASRLRLAKLLLRDDGVVFVSIDHREVSNLRQLMDEIYGRDNIVFDVAVVNNLKGRNDREGIATCHEHLLIYKKPGYKPLGVSLSEDQKAEYSEVDASGKAFQWRDLRKRGGADTRKVRPKMYFPVYVDPDSGSVRLESDSNHSQKVFPTKSDGSEGCWRWGKEKVAGAVDQMWGLEVRDTGRWNISYRIYLETEDGQRRSTPKSVWSGPQFSSDSGTKSLAALMPGIPANKFTPKAVGLLQSIVDQSCAGNDLVMDLFSGSGSFVEAVFRQNEIDSATRHYIAVQVAAPVEIELPLKYASISSIADLAKERIRRAGTKIKSEAGDKAKDLDVGFRVLKIDSSNLKDVFYRPDAVTQQSLLGDVDHVKPDRTDEDLLFQVLLDWGVDLTLPITSETIQNRRVFFVDGNALAACFDAGLDEDFVKELAKREPLRAVFRDGGYATDAAKINVEQVFKLLSPATEVKTV